MAESKTPVSTPEEKGQVINDPAGTNIDPLAEKELLRKCDLRILPPLFILFLLAFIDRVSIGNAKIQGLEKDLHMSGSDYNIALFAFFPTYILFEIPSNLVLKKVAPSIWLSSIMLLWGIVTVGMGLVRTFGGLVAMRVLLGLFEAGIFPGCVYLISMFLTPHKQTFWTLMIDRYYKRYELQWRLSLFFASSIIAGGFGGLFAFAIAKMDGIGGYGGWRWIFIIEGLLTIFFGALSFFWITDWPETSAFLTPTQRTLLLTRLSTDTGPATMNRLDKSAAKRTFRDPKIYLGTLMYLGVVNTGNAGSFFIPTIIREMGFTSAAAQIRSIPIYVVATVTSLITAWLTDRLRHRYAFCMFGLVVASIGYIILLAQDNLSTGVKYFALFLIVPGGFITQPVAIVWLSNLVSGHYKRSVSSAMQVGFGNIGGIVASNIFLSSQAPKYPVGYGVSLGLLWVCGAACTVMFFLVRWENAKRERGERDYRLEEVDADNLGDDHPGFRLTT
ncbi:MFS general substrate transporter [Byssothecium circinans]|uniref:MFS general substrate transporter n=1 Tax=Byssothecium circinans TaxID=147558 RepID=A0A6A5U6J0_9PLEO|nr:MFS general substrate transporter [Byssothecium circinans]